jgi:glycosyltransferase involved in cell wall biosynthesis
MKNTMYNPSFNIVCTTIGRESLPRLIDSFKNQLLPDDTFTIISDTNHEFVKNVLSNYNFNFKLNHIINDGEVLGKYGHPLLNKYINNLEGDFIMFADDDDYYVDDAFENIRKYVVEKKLYVFKHKWGDTINWTVKEMTLGNIGKCMGVIPNTKTLPMFQENIFGDGLFYEDLAKIFEYEFVDKIIYKVRDTI